LSDMETHIENAPCNRPFRAVSNCVFCARFLCAACAMVSICRWTRYCAQNCRHDQCVAITRSKKREWRRPLSQIELVEGILVAIIIVVLLLLVHEQVLLGQQLCVIVEADRRSSRFCPLFSTMSAAKRRRRKLQHKRRREERKLL
jgi:hypothetical protein